MFVRVLLVLASIVLAACAVPSPLAGPDVLADDPNMLIICRDLFAGRTNNPLATTKILNGTLESYQQRLTLEIPSSPPYLDKVLQGLKINLCTYIGGDSNLYVYNDKYEPRLKAEGRLTVQRPDLDDKRFPQPVYVSVTAYYSLGKPLESTVLEILGPWN